MLLIAVLLSSFALWAAQGSSAADDCGLTLQGDYNVRIRHRHTTSHGGHRKNASFATSPASFSQEHAAKLIARFTTLSCSAEDGVLYNLRLFNFSQSVSTANNSTGGSSMEHLDLPLCITQAISAHVEATFLQQPSGAYDRHSLKLSGQDKLRKQCASECETAAGESSGSGGSACSDSKLMEVFGQIAHHVDTR